MLTSGARVLVSAFNFSPVQGSEFAIGWDYVRAIAEHNHVWVITRSTERAEIEAYLREHPELLPGIKILYVPWTFSRYDLPFWELLYYIHLRRWQRQEFHLARMLDSALNFDLIHHVTGTGFRSVGYLWKLGKPFVWGPVGGMQYFPLKLLNAVPFRNRPFLLAKNIATYFAMRSRRPKAAARAAKLVIAGTSEAAERIKQLWGVDAPVLCEVSAPDINELAVLLGGQG